MEILKPKLKKGFALLDAAARSRIGVMGGTAAHEGGRAYKFDSKTASLAAKARWAKRKSA